MALNKPKEKETGVSDEDLIKAEERFKEAVKLVYSEPERSVMLLGQVLEVRNKKYGDNAIECAETYMEYGRALLEQARSNTDVLGAQMRTAVNKHDINDDEKKEDNEKKKAEAQHSEAEPTTEAGKTSSAQEGQEAEAAEGDKEEGSGGQDKNSEGEGSEDSESSESGDDQDDEQEGEEEGAGDDMQLAWEMLELARLIYDKNGGDAQWASLLADVHLLLGELSQEREQFEGAVEEFSACARLLTTLPPDQALRRRAEVHFKAVYPLQVLDRLPEARDHCRTALALLEGRKKEIEQIMDTPVEGESGEEADEAIEKLEGELEDLEAIMSDLKEKEEEVVQAIKEHASMKQVLLSAMQAFAAADIKGGAKAAAGSGAGAAGASGAQQQQQPVGGGAAPSLATGAKQVAAGPVRDLGVVGRGRTRITLQPLKPADGATAGAQQAGAAKVDGGAAGGGKRRLEDIMGGSGAGGVTTIGFGVPAGAAGAAGGIDVGKLDAMMAKRMRTDAPATPPAPAPVAEKTAQPGK